jgi:sorbitol/mannitol transport system permease protein
MTTTAVPPITQNRVRRTSAGSRVTGPILTGVTWLIALLFFFPVGWMVISGFKTEAVAAELPPRFIFEPTLQQYENMVNRGVVPYALNSLMASVLSTLFVIVLAIPAAYALSMRPIAKWRDGLFFFLSTKMLPIAGAIAAIYLLAQTLHLLDNIWVLVILYTSMNLPIAVWMIRSFMLEIPIEIVEAAKVDGASFIRMLTTIIFPLLAPGLSSAALICFIFAWNEFFLAVNLTSTTASTLPVFLTGFITSEGLFWAQLSAAATLCAIPVVIAGWVSQKQLVRGLSLGAVK